jgi:prevent-host-death family protein
MVAFELVDQRPCREATVEGTRAMYGSHSNVVTVAPEHNLVAGFDAELGAQVLGDDDLPFRANLVSHTVKYNCISARSRDVPRTVPVREFRSHLADLLDEVAERREHVIITRQRRPAAVVIPINEYSPVAAGIVPRCASTFCSTQVTGGAVRNSSLHRLCTAWSGPPDLSIHRPHGGSTGSRVHVLEQLRVDGRVGAEDAQFAVAFDHDRVDGPDLCDAVQA